MPHRFPFLLALLALAASGCARSSAGLPEGMTVEDLPDGESWNAELRVSEDGRQSLALGAPYMARFDRPDTAYVYLGPPPQTPDSVQARITVQLFDESGEPSATISARQAWYYERQKRLVADGGVKAETFGDGATAIEANRLRYTSGGDFSASGEARVDVRGAANAKIRARTISGRLDGGRYTAEGDVFVDAGGGRSLRSARVTWDGSRFRAPGAFSFTGPGERIRGVGLTANADLSRYSFSQMRGEIDVQE
ncbi:hypothetical protein [Rubricoccus marinus]|uniref:LPS export ABC transporter periplasmic protein LptC n=1 Tax=Rubricoccus marinus TaxID=716817 RepID=A0A259TZV6_9BACT|nr:hypothetical protein [Rubricoccus marinus]OZC03261.1 hypothetical protein BSZ36_09895 [Rubricoccus marinus]